MDQPLDIPETRRKLDQLLPELYDDLRQLASRQLSRERADHTLQTTALVHEAYLRLSCQRTVDWDNDQEVLRAAIAFMRRILVDHARGKKSDKRRADGVRISLSDYSPDDQVKSAINAIEIDEALTQLESLDPRQALIVELRYFGGLTLAETAANVGISLATVKREWSMARAWLYTQLQGSA